MKKDLSWIPFVDSKYNGESLSKIISRVNSADRDRIYEWYTSNSSIRWYINKLKCAGEVYIREPLIPLVVELAETLINNGYKVTYDSEKDGYLIEDL